MTSPDPMANPFANPDPSRSGGRLFLRLIAVFGVIVVLLQEAITAFPLKPRQEYGLIVLVFATPIVLFTIAFGLPSAWRTLIRHPELLIPLGILTLAEAVVGWLMLVPTVAQVLSPSKQFQIAAISLSVSGGFLLSIALNVAYGAWTTTMILQAARQEPIDPAKSFSSCWRWFLRVLGLEFIGWVVLFAGLALGLALAPVSMVLAIPVIGILALIWNLATAALLLVALDKQLGFGHALRTGIRISWANKGRWWKPVVAQMLLLGWVTLIAVSYSESTSRGYTNHSSTNWAVNAFWTGGFENECRWFGGLMKAVNAPKLAVISTILGLVYGVLAIAVKLTIAERLGLRSQESDETAALQHFQPENEETGYLPA